METVKVFVVGASLGDPDILTRKAERVLGSADAVIHDRQVSAQVLCLANREAEVVPVNSGGSQEERQADVFGWYLRLRDHCQSIVRLVVSDPLLAGECSEEYEFLARHGFEIEVLPTVLAETVYESRAAVREAITAAREAAKVPVQ
jgi:siroheme synthase